jgi:hypothetical protein
MVRVLFINICLLIIIYLFCVFFSLPIISLVFENLLIYVYEILMALKGNVFKIFFFLFSIFNFLTAFLTNIDIYTFDKILYKILLIIYFLKNNLFSIYYFLSSILGFIFNTNIINLTNIMSYSIYLFIFVFFRYVRYVDLIILEEIFDDEDFQQYVWDEEVDQMSNFNYSFDSFLSHYNQNDFYFRRNMREDLYLFDIFIPDTDYISSFDETNLIDEKELDSTAAEGQIFFSRGFINFFDIFDKILLKIYLFIFPKFNNPLSFYSSLIIKILFFPTLLILLYKKIFNLFYYKIKKK